MTGLREAQLQQAADLLLDARRTGQTIADLPRELQIASVEEASFVQDQIAAAFGAVGGYKIGAPSLEATPTFAPMPTAWIYASGVELPGRLRILEAEIAFLVGEDLSPRDTPYTREEVFAAMASCHPAIEVLESGFTDNTAVAKLTGAADLQFNGAFVYGAPIANWRNIDWNNERVTLAVDGVGRVDRTGSNTSGDLMRLPVFLANEGAARTGGLRRGQWITTGSWTGNTPALAASFVTAEFCTAGRVECRFE
jgi:2-keto-4-pentenoate hydratase